MFKKLFLTASLIVGFSTVANANNNFGCEALLCFAGGKNVSECKSTIRKVTKDMARGKPFPYCQLIGADNKPVKNDVVSSSVYKTRSQRGSTCQDGVTVPFKQNRKYYCNTIEINIDPKYAVDKAHQKQFYNF